ncbi:hypothetical protein EDWATA_01645 [Edwardsiella tarda ATCC 23685]|uniref:Uncharacterized protein n=1 Tax=Edwardsiella tarda ATCC 23685 TaxID=500638 RepID=D4F4H4_EDWTA|nr:hypothetical protein EDWATA_01645 [Edwardsiella tarda ATCC 23685]
MGEMAGKVVGGVNRRRQASDEGKVTQWPRACPRGWGAGARR